MHWRCFLFNQENIKMSDTIAITLTPYLFMISTFLIYFYFYNLRKNKHKDFQDVTNFDLVDDTIYDPYTADEKADYRDDYKESNYYKYVREHSLKFQNQVKNFLPTKYFEMIDELLEQAGRKYNMKAMEFVSTTILMFLLTFTFVTILSGFMFHYGILAGMVAALLFPVNDVLIEPRRKRANQIRLELPKTLDFFYILMQAGNSFTESLKEIAYSSDTALSIEFRRIIDEIENKKIPSLQAYVNSTKRVNLEGYSNFMKTIQAEQELGANIVEQIKEKSDDLKDEYMTEKEKEIEKLQNKIIIPILFFFLPPVIFAFFGPQFYDMFRMIV